MRNSTETKNELVQDVESIFQFVIMVSIFFLTFIDILFKYSNSTSDQMSLAEFKWVNMPIALVVGYLIFRIYRKRLPNRVLSITNFLLLAEIFFAVVAITVVLVNGNQIHSYFAYYTLIISLWVTMSLSTVISTFLLVTAIFFKEKKDFKSIE